jgi:hypothetical protein
MGFLSSSSSNIFIRVGRMSSFGLSSSGLSSSCGLSSSFFSSSTLGSSAFFSTGLALLLPAFAFYCIFGTSG